MRWQVSHHLMHHSVVVVDSFDWIYQSFCSRFGTQNPAYLDYDPVYTLPQWYRCRALSQLRHRTTLSQQARQIFHVQSKSEQDILRTIVVISVRVSVGVQYLRHSLWWVLAMLPVQQRMKKNTISDVILMLLKQLVLPVLHGLAISSLLRQVQEWRHLKRSLLSMVQMMKSAVQKYAPGSMPGGLNMYENYVCKRFSQVVNS